MSDGWAACWCWVAASFHASRHKGSACLWKERGFVALPDWCQTAGSATKWRTFCDTKATFPGHLFWENAIWLADALRSWHHCSEVHFISGWNYSIRSDLVFCVLTSSYVREPGTSPGLLYSICLVMARSVAFVWLISKRTQTIFWALHNSVF